MFLILALLGCDSSVVLADDNLVVSAAGTDNDATADAPPSIVIPAGVYFHAPVTTSNEWTQTWVAFHLAIDDNGELLTETEQPSGDFQPQVTFTILSQLASCTSHIGVAMPPSTVANVDTVSIQATALEEMWIYSKTQIVQGVDVMQVDATGNVLGHMQWEEGNNPYQVTFTRCDGCEARDPPE